MKISSNILDPKVIDNILKNSEFNKDLTLEELINIIDNNPNRYSCIYTKQNKVLHITDNEGICYYDINISIKSKKIFINIEKEKDINISITKNLTYTQNEELVDSILIKKYSNTV